MSSVTHQQLEHLLSESYHALVCLPQEAEVDHVSAALAFTRHLNTHNVSYDLASDQFNHATFASLLPDAPNILSRMPQLERMLISLDLGTTSLENISYRITDSTLDIFLDPKHGTFNSTPISAKRSAYRYDLIITFGTPNFVALGSLFHDHPSFFYALPIINIDHQSHNERFGQLNIVTPTASSVSEIIYDLFAHHTGSETISETLAHTLLVGIMSATNGLRSTRLTPQLLEKVSTLITRGADVVAINKQLFHTKSFTMLKLWGRVLSRMQEDTSLSLVWSLIHYNDFIDTHSSREDLPRIIHELIDSYQQPDLCLLLWQNQDGTISGLLKTTPTHNALELIASFDPLGKPDLAEFSLPAHDLVEGEALILRLLRRRLPQSK